MLRPRRRYAHRLAEIMGRTDVDGMLSEMTEDEFRQWRGFHRLEPSGQPAEDARNARLCGVIHHQPPHLFLFRPMFAEDIEAAAEQAAAAATPATPAEIDATLELMG